MNFCFVGIVTFLISDLFVLKLPHLGTVLSDSVLGLFDGVFLLVQLLLHLSQLQERLAVGLVFLIELFVQVALIRIPLLVDFLDLQLYYEA